MAFTTRTITHTFVNADGTPASGSVEFTLTKRMTNGGVTIVPAKITAPLDTEGKISQSLTVNTDVDTIPQDASWRVDWRIMGSPMPESYFITVAPGEGSVDLGSLLPQQPIGG